MARRSEMFERLLDELADDEWHDMDKVISTLGLLVLPSRAIEVLEEQRRRVSQSPERVGYLSRDEQIVMGRRYSPRQLIQSKIATGDLEQRTVQRNGRSVRQIKRMPQDAVSASRVAKLCGRSTSTITYWLTSPESRKWVQNKLPANISPGYNYGRNGRMWRIPLEAVEVWKQYSSGQPSFDKPARAKALNDAMSGVFDDLRNHLSQSLGVDADVVSKALDTEKVKDITEAVRLAMLNSGYVVRKATQHKSRARHSYFPKPDEVPSTERHEPE